MKENMMIKIKNTYSAGEFSGSMESFSRGYFYSDDGFHFYRYEEDIDADCCRSHVELKVSAEYLAMKRCGEMASSEMFFMNDYIHDLLYETPYGSLSMKLYTDEIVICLNEDGSGHVNIVYDLFTGGTCPDRHVLSFDFSCIKDK